MKVEDVDLGVMAEIISAASGEKDPSAPNAGDNYAGKNYEAVDDHAKASKESALDPEIDLCDPLLFTPHQLMVVLKKIIGDMLRI